MISCRREDNVHGKEGIQGRAATVHLFICLPVHMFTCSPGPPHRCWTSVVAGMDPARIHPWLEYPESGFLPGTVQTEFPATLSATGSGHLQPWLETGLFPAMEAGWAFPADRHRQLVAPQTGC